MSTTEPMYWRYLRQETQRILGIAPDYISPATAELMRQDLIHACEQAQLHAGPTALQVVDERGSKRIGDFTVTFMAYALNAGEPHLGSFFIWQETDPGMNAPFATVDLLLEGGLAIYDRDDSSPQAMTEIMARALILTYIQQEPQQ